MNEKAMVSDTLAGINSELVRMSEMISQTENPQLKNMLKQMRNQCEASQEEIYQIARARQYYVPADNQHLKDALRIVWYFVLPHLRCHFGRCCVPLAHSILAS